MLIRATPGDPQYGAVLDKQFNKRFRAKPDYVQPASSNVFRHALSVQRA
jgi:hypothetical protein